MNKDTQTAIGSGNVQIHINNLSYNVKDVYKGITKFFEEFDDEINKYFPQEIEYSKFDDVRCKFKTSKILSSLVKIGIPFESALSIVYNVDLTILDECEAGAYKDGLSTHKIRKVVAKTILNYPVDEASHEDIEKWADKYIRKYGHDGQRIKVFYDDSDRERLVDYDFLKKELLNDIINDLGIRNEAYKQTITANQIQSISEEIIELLNDCNMYKIDYNTLKNFIKQMALQPPHPWFVTKETAKEICQYDLNILQDHHAKLCKAVEMDCFDDVYYTIYEALHHSCSSILARYLEVLGCKDLDAFYNLERITTSLCNRDEKDILMDNYAISNLPMDLQYISIDLMDLLNLLRRIKKKLRIGKLKSILEKNTVMDVITLCEIAEKLDHNIHKDDMAAFLYADWSGFSNETRKEYVQRFFQVIEGLETRNVITGCPDCFWINRKSHKDEKHYFTICMNDDLDYEKIVEFMSKKQRIQNTQAILLIVENQNAKIDSNIINVLENQYYYVITIYKEDLQRIFNSKNQYSEFDRILYRILE